MNLIIFGPPGAGKGTQSKRLVKSLGIAHISTGDLFRYNIRNRTELGEKARVYTDQGLLVPDEITISMLRQRLQQSDVDKGFLLDGFPRNVQQCEALDEILAVMGREIDCVINLRVDDRELRARLKKRAEIENRADDADPEVIENRLETYKQESRPCLDFYRPKGLVMDVDGTGSIEEVFDRVSGALV